MIPGDDAAVAVDLYTPKDATGESTVADFSNLVQFSKGGNAPSHNCRLPSVNPPIARWFAHRSEQASTTITLDNNFIRALSITFTVNNTEERLQDEWTTKQLQVAAYGQHQWQYCTVLYLCR